MQIFHMWRQSHTRQKAPSAKRCIKTRINERVVFAREVRQKAPSAKRCIKTPTIPVLRLTDAAPSESTERQKVH